MHVLRQSSGRRSRSSCGSSSTRSRSSPTGIRTRSSSSISRSPRRPRTRRRSSCSRRHARPNGTSCTASGSTSATRHSRKPPCVDPPARAAARVEHDADEAGQGPHRRGREAHARDPRAADEAALGAREILDERRGVERVVAIGAAISSLVGFVPSRKSSRRISPVRALRHQSSPTSPTRYTRSCAARIHARR